MIIPNAHTVGSEFFYSLPKMVSFFFPDFKSQTNLMDLRSNVDLLCLLYNKNNKVKDSKVLQLRPKQSKVKHSEAARREISP